MGLGGKIGSGRQYMSWISIIDTVLALEHLMFNGDLEGPVNLVSPNAVTNGEFIKILGNIERLPTIFPFPGWLARLVIGEMAGDVLLASQKVVPQKLINSDFGFRFQKLEETLRHILGK